MSTKLSLIGKQKMTELMTQCIENDLTLDELKARMNKIRNQVDCIVVRKIDSVVGYEVLKDHPTYLINPKKGIIAHKNSLQILESFTKAYDTVSIGGKISSIHRTVWYHCKGLIPKGMVIDHLDSNPHNNSIDNLECVTTKENNARAAKNRVYTTIMPKLKVKRPIKAVCVDDGTFEIYDCMNSASKALLINCGIISYCADGKNNVKSGISKKNQQKYRFEWTTEKPTKIVPRKSFKKEEKAQLEEANNDAEV